MKLKDSIHNVGISKLLRGIFYVTSVAGILSALLAIYTFSSILGGQDLSELKKYAVCLIAVMAFFCVLFVFQAIFFRSWVTKSVFEPIRTIADVTEKFSKGNLGVQIDYRSRNEIGMISSSLNMAFALLKQDVSEISGILNRISDGNLRMEIDRDYTGDFAPITDAFRGILEKLNHIFAVIQRTADQVNIGAQQVSTAAQQLAQGATEQAASVEELASSTQEISASIQETSEHIDKVNSYMAETTNDIQMSNQKMKQMLSAMEGINASTDEIRKIIKAIDEIAFQTNILALNAAVEAARGRSGQGFRGRRRRGESACEQIRRCSQSNDRTDRGHHSQGERWYRNRRKHCESIGRGLRTHLQGQ